MESQKTIRPGEKPAQQDQTVESYRKILVGYDGSENSKRALERTIALATAQGATIRIAVAANTIPFYGQTAGYYPADYAGEAIKQGKKSLTGAVKLAEELGAKVSGFVKDGYAAEVILDAEGSEGVDLIVVGRRGMSGVKRFLMGSVSSSVVSHSKCDVLIVR